MPSNGAHECREIWDALLIVLDVRIGGILKQPR